jgi:hypothetical protein
VNFKSVEKTQNCPRLGSVAGPVILAIDWEVGI